MFNDHFGLTQAVLEGRKTQTRRIAQRVKYKPGEVVAVAQSYKSVFEEQQDDTLEMLDLLYGLIRDSFIIGAKWCINSVWHDGTASCEAGRKALVLFDNGNANVYKDLRDLSVEQLWGYVDKFAYLDDLLPDEGKETRQ